MQSPITLGLIAVTALVSWLAFKDRRLVDRLILWPPAVSQRHQYWRLASYGLLHADVSHLLFNMITLFFFGRLIEQVIVQLTGSWLTYPLFYLTALVVSILPSYLRNQGNRNYFSLGASGAVSTWAMSAMEGAPLTLAGSVPYTLLLESKDMSFKPSSSISRASSRISSF